MTEPAPPGPPAETGEPPPWGRRRYRGDYAFWWGGGSWGVFWGVALVIVGALFLLKNVGLLPFIGWEVIWPILLIALGVFFIVRRLR
ncbi:MAG TPA: DUF5668 domain-containing protein [Candidatus Acidoferrales bacterium]|nr:DUF5668 domain-containing protein [Candidatus Acidoferrales bacterium]